MENLRIAVTGNIGVGKSTLVDRIKNTSLQEHLWPHLPDGCEKAIHTYPEMFTTEVLEAFYGDPIKHAFLAQQEFLNGRLERQYQIEQAHGIILEDRTLFEDYHIFGKAQKIMGHMSHEQFLVYQRNFELMTQKVDEPDLVVYLRANVDTLLQRIKLRGRESEQGIGRDYLELLNNLYESYVTRHVRCPVLIIDTNEPRPLEDYLASTVKQVAAKIAELNLRITTPGIREWMALPETEAALRAIDAERRLEDHLKNNPSLITVAGNVGMGKSTLTALMHQSLRIQALYEKPEKNPLLNQFLNDKPRYCYQLQRHFLKLREAQRKRGKAGDASFVKDRSLAEDILIFCKNFHNQGILKGRELDLLETEFQKVNRSLPQADVLIVLQGRTELAWQRIQQRARTMEVNGGWSFNEIRELNHLYRTYAEDVQHSGYHNNPIIQVNTDQLDLTNRVHMGYLFERLLDALKEGKSQTVRTASHANEEAVCA